MKEFYNQIIICKFTKILIEYHYLKRKKILLNDVVLAPLFLHSVFYDARFAENIFEWLALLNET